MNQFNSIQSWLSVKNAVVAAEFYKDAFNAIETYRLEMPDGLVVRLSVNGAEFWVSGGSDRNESSNKEELAGNIRMILITNEPEAVFEKALQTGAKEIFPVGEEYGWKLGRVEDPFGLHWEIGHPLNA